METNTYYMSADSKKFSLSVLVHVICWTMFMAFPLLMTQKADGTMEWHVFFKHMAFPFCGCILFYINYFLLIPRLFFENKRLHWFIIVNSLLVVLLAFVIREWHSFFYDMLHEVLKRKRSIPRYVFIIRDICSLAFIVGVSIAVRYSIRWREADMARREAEKSRAEAELKNLQNQLNPHFLLNTLNNIYALIAIDTEKAQEAIHELSKLLRYVLYDNHTEYVPLSKEVNFIRNYIELMRIRLGNHVTVETSFDIKPDSRTPIAPLIFISLIENAFKHGVSPTQQSFIRIHIAEDDKQITATISNSNHPKHASDKSGSGIGLEQVNRRLALAYPNRHRWTTSLSEDGTIYTSVITIIL